MRTPLHPLNGEGPSPWSLSQLPGAPVPSPSPAVTPWGPAFLPATWPWSSAAPETPCGQQSSPGHHWPQPRWRPQPSPRHLHARPFQQPPCCSWRWPLILLPKTCPPPTTLGLPKKHKCTLGYLIFTAWLRPPPNPHRLRGTNWGNLKLQVLEQPQPPGFRVVSGPVPSPPSCPHPNLRPCDHVA